MANIVVPPSDEVMTSPDMYVIDRQNMGTAVIICNVNFIPEITRKARTEQAKDIPRLQKILEQLGFKVEIHIDLTTTKILVALDEASSECDRASSCFMCVISSHGDWHSFEDTDRTPYLSDLIYGTDGVLSLKEITHRVRTAEALKDKPKIFLFQSCRGDGYMSSVDIEEDNGRVTSTKEKTFAGSDVKFVAGTRRIKPEDYMTRVKRCLPFDLTAKRDYFLHFATCPGYVSFPKLFVGTPFLQAWCDALSLVTVTREIHDLATIVNAKVCEEYESMNKDKADAGGHQRKQTPQIVSMLSKDFLFPVCQVKHSDTAELARELDVQLHT